MRTKGWTIVTLVIVALALLPCTRGSFAVAAEIPAGEPADGAPATPAPLELDLAGGQPPPCVTCWGFGARLAVASIDGKPALTLTYAAARTTTAGLAFHALDLPADASCLQMRLRVAAPTSVAIDLYERGGARYQAFYLLPGGEWSNIDMPLGEFWLGERSRDADGRLDPDQVQRMTVRDLANLRGLAGLALGLKDGPQEMDVARLYVGPGKCVARTKVADGRAAIDDGLELPLALLPVGGPDIAVADLGSGPELEVRYQFGGYRWAGFLRGVGQLPVERMVALQFRAHADPRVRVHVVLEQRDGAKFEAVSLLTPGPPQAVDLPLEMFHRSGPGPGTPTAPDVAQLRAVVFVADTFSTRLKRGEQGRFWISRPALELGPAAPQQ